MSVTDATCEPWPVDMSCHAEGWYTVDSVVPGGFDLSAQLDMQTKAVAWATAMLWKRTRRQIGECSYTVRICPPPCDLSLGCDGMAGCRCGPQSVSTRSSS